MDAANKILMEPHNWQEWIDACSVENCQPDTAHKLSTFGRNRLRSALQRYDSQLAHQYCDPEGRNAQTAWLKVEQYLYAGPLGEATREGKAYKNRLLNGCANLAHFEARLTLKIQREIARWILADECYHIAQRRNPDTGRKTYIATRLESLDIADTERQSADIDIEPATSEDESAIAKSAAEQANHVWTTLDTQRPSVRKLLLTCFLNNIFDIQLILTSGLVACRQSQLYNERKKLFTLLSSLDWDIRNLGAAQRAYLTRRMMPHLKGIAEEWLARVENRKLRLFIETVRNTLPDRGDPNG
jgi:hypothetical protein